MQIHQKIRHRIDLLLQNLCNSLCNSSVFLSRKFPVQIFPIRRIHLPDSRIKSGFIDHRYKNQPSRHIFRLQFLSQLTQGLHSYILTAMHTRCDYQCFSRFFSLDHQNPDGGLIRHFQLNDRLFSRCCLHIILPHGNRPPQNQ